jgi:hypothetical protein
MKYAVYTREGYDYGTPYGVYGTAERAIEVREWLESLGNVCIIEEVEK